MTVLEIAGETVELLGPTEARVKSKSTEGRWYAIDLYHRTCTCMSYQVRKRCRHLQTVLDFAASGAVTGSSPAPADSPPAAEVFPLDLATSRFAARDLILASGRVPVRITVGRPRYKLPYQLGGFAPELAPYGPLFAMNEREEFEPAFRARLDRIGFTAIHAALCAISAKHEGRPLLLLCYEDVSGGKDWCHRQIVAAWWQERTGEEVPELDS